MCVDAAWVCSAFRNGLARYLDNLFANAGRKGNSVLSAWIADDVTPPSGKGAAVSLIASRRSCWAKVVARSVVRAPRPCARPIQRVGVRGRA